MKMLIEKIMAKVPQEKNLEVKNYISVTDFSEFIKNDDWTEDTWNGESFCTNIVKAEIWSDAIQYALDKYKYVSIPYFDKPIYLDKPIIMESGSNLFVHKDTRIHLKPHTGTCMLRNKGLDKNRNSDITIMGGIWSNLANGLICSNGNGAGRSDRENFLDGSHGVFVFYNACNITVSDLTITECSCYGIQLGKVSNFRIENIYYHNHKRDGVHVLGECNYGLIRNLSGNTGDDFVALNAWDWKGYTTAFGNISYILVDGIKAVGNEIRLLPGKKDNFDCNINDCVFCNIEGIYTFKMYCQHDLESLVHLGIENHSEAAGNLKNIYLENIKIEKLHTEALFDIPMRGIIELCANAENIAIENFIINSTISKMIEKDFALVSIGPMSAVWKVDKNNPEKWHEIFEPNMSCTATNISTKSIKFLDGFCSDKNILLKERYQTPNPDYPNTLPKGGTGKGKLLAYKCE